MKVIMSINSRESVTRSMGEILCLLFESVAGVDASRNHPISTWDGTEN